MRIYIPLLFSLLFLNLTPSSARAQTPERVADFHFGEPGTGKYEANAIAALADGSVLIATGFQITYADSIGRLTWPRRKSGGGLIWLDAGLEKKREFVWPDRSVEKIVRSGDRIFLCGNDNTGNWRYDPIWVAEIDLEGKLLRETQICRHCPFTYVEDLQADSIGNLYVLLVKELEYARERMRKAWLPTETGDTTLQRYPSDIKEVLQLWHISAAGKSEWHKTLAEPNYEGFLEARMHVTGEGFDIAYEDMLTDRTFHTWLAANRKTLTERPLDREEVYFTNAGMLMWKSYTRELKLYEGKTLKAYATVPKNIYLRPRFLLDRPGGGYLAFGFEGSRLMTCTWLDKDLRVEQSRNERAEGENIPRHIACMPDGSVLVLKGPYINMKEQDAPGHIELLRLRP